MTRTKRSFTPEERLSLLQEAEREGFMETCRKHNLSPTLLSKWKQRYLTKGTDGLKPAYRRVDPEIRALQDENEKLRRIIANQALELEVKSALLKKTPIQPKRR
jgi:putative transposase